MTLFQTGRATNSLTYTGKLYDFDITIRDNKKGGGHMAFGSIQLAITDDLTTIVPLRFFANSINKNGEPNKLFVFLLDLIKSGATIVDRKEKDTVFELRKKISVEGMPEEFGAHLSMMPRVSSKTGEGVPVLRAIGNFESNSYVNQQDEEITTTERKLGFLMTSREESLSSTFEADVFLSSALPRMDKEGNETGDVVLKGMTFDFRDGVVPVEFRASGDGALDYFEGLMASEETRMVRLNGREISQVLISESAPALTGNSWGKTAAPRQIRTYDKAFVVEGAADLSSNPFDPEVLKASIAQYRVDSAQKFADARDRKKATPKPALAPEMASTATSSVAPKSSIFDL